MDAAGFIEVLRAAGATSISEKGKWIESSCPLPDHEDVKPSFYVHSEDGNWICKSHPTGELSGPWDLLLRKLGRGDLITEPTSGLGRSLAERYHETLVNDAECKRMGLLAFRPQLYKALEDRAIDVPSAVARFMLGITPDGPEGARLTIPHFTSDGRGVSAISLYAPGSSNKLKVDRPTGTVPVPFFNMPDMVKDKLWIVGGETKAIVLRQRLPDTSGVISLIDGEDLKNIKPYVSMFNGKTVYVCMDVDPKGRNAGAQIARALSPFASATYLIDLAGYVDDKPKGDINDFFAAGHTLDTLAQIVKSPSTKVYRPSPTTLEMPEDTQTVRVTRLWEARNHLNCEVVVPTVFVQRATTTTYMPTKIELQCSGYKRPIDGNMFCADCPALKADGDVYAQTPPTPHRIARYISDPKTALSKGLATFVGGKEMKRVVPSLDTEVCRLRGKKPTSAEGLAKLAWVRIDDGGVTSEPPAHGIVLIGPDTTDRYNIVSSVTGVPVIDDEMKGLFVVTKISSSLETMVPEEDELHAAKREFYCDSNSQTELEGKWNDIIDDLLFHHAMRNTLTARRDVMRVMDLTALSSLYFRETPEGDDVGSWLRTMVVGDPALGKSASRDALIKVYGLDENQCSIENVASLAGLIGGVVNIAYTSKDREFTVQWGALPRQDRQVLFLDEMLRARDQQLWKELAGVLSSGRATVAKVKSANSHARTRLVAICNPTDADGNPRLMDDFGVDGFEVLRQLPLDEALIRRYHIVLFLRQSVPLETFSKPSRAIPPKAHRGILRWSWTNQASILEVNKQQVLEEIVNPLVDKYKAEYAPVLIPGGAWEKVASVACAIGRRFMQDRIREVHFRMAATLLDRIYGGPDCAHISAKTENARTVTEHRRRLATQISSTDMLNLLAMMRMMGSGFRNSKMPPNLTAAYGHAITCGFIKADALTLEGRNHLRFLEESSEISVEHGHPSEEDY